MGKEYLLRRGYTESLIKEDSVSVYADGAYNIDSVSVRLEYESVIWPCVSMAGQLVGVQSRRIDKKEYNWHSNPSARYLPVVYASSKDHDLLYNTGEVILTEGPFDRVAVKRCFSDIAVYSRLSKGMSKQLTHFLKRYATRVWIMFDTDDPGREAADEAEEKLADYLTITPILYPAKDPSELLERVGVLNMMTMLRQRMSQVRV